MLRPSFPWPGHRAGQYVRLGAEINGIRHWRAYTITSDPGHPEGLVSVTVQTVETGLMSEFLNDAERSGPGTRVWLGLVEGEFTLPESFTEPLLMISAGCGITPIWAMLRELERRGAVSDVVHLHGARDAQRFVFGRPLRELAAESPATASTNSTARPTVVCTAKTSTGSCRTGGSGAPISLAPAR